MSEGRLVLGVCGIALAMTAPLVNRPPFGLRREAITPLAQG
jgi:hypothetical protein